MVKRIVLGLFFVLAAQHLYAGGPKGSTYDVDMVGAYSSVTYTETFYGGEWTKVTLDGDGDTDLDIFVYDANGNLIVSHTGGGDSCWVSFLPYFTGEFTIRVVNHGGVPNVYEISAQ